jgi:LacI family transcriptional regulator
MKEIAELAGVSRPAVSAVLNNRHDSSIKVSKEKRERILDLARNLKYRPNFSAVQLTGKRDRSIGIISGCYQTGVNSEFNRQLAIKLRVENYQAYFVGVTDPKHELDTINDFISRGMSGIISNYTLNNIRQKDYPIPMVFVSERMKDHDIITDLELGGYAMTRHLIDHGHRRIVFACSQLRYNEMKYAGFQRACREAALPVPEKDILEFSWNAGFAEQIDHLIREKKVTAFFLNGDLLAGEFMAWLQDHGYRVPEDIAIAGCDGLEIANIMRVPLTTIIQPVRKLAEQAVGILLDKIEGHRCGRIADPVRVEPEFRLSRSCGCPAHDKKHILWEWLPISLERTGQNIKPLPPQFHGNDGVLSLKELTNRNTGGIRK